MRRLHVLAVASEIFPLIKTGGLADVVGALPPALARENIATRTLIPGYPAVLRGAARRRGGPYVRAIARRAGAAPRRARGRSRSLRARCASPLRAPRQSVRRVPTATNGPTTGFASPRSPRAPPRSRAAPSRATRPTSCTPTTGRRASFRPCSTTRGAPRPATVMTVHNLSFQGQFPRELLATIGLPPHAYALDGVEYHGTIGYLKAGLALADRITTVSPTYAAEIRTPEDGMGLDGLLRKRAGVLDRHPQRHRRRRVESGDRRLSPCALRRQAPCAARREQDGAAGAVRARARSGGDRCSASSAA